MVALCKDGIFISQWIPFTDLKAAPRPVPGTRIGQGFKWVGVGLGVAVLIPFSPFLFLVSDGCSNCATHSSVSCPLTTCGSARAILRHPRSSLDASHQALRRDAVKEQLRRGIRQHLCLIASLL